MSETKFKLSIVGIAFSYLSWKFFLIGFIFPIVNDYMKYKNTKLEFDEDFISFTEGGFTNKTKEIPFEDIKSVRIRQSFLGQIFNYGDIIVVMKDLGDDIIFRAVEGPEVVSKAIKSQFVKSSKVKLV